MLPYDATRDALLHPESRDPVFAAGDRPLQDALAAETGRLAYFRFERSPADRGRLEDAMQRIGCAAPTAFTNEATGTQAFAALRASDGLRIVAFRGTQPDALKDFLTDARFAPSPFARGHVHGGFLAAYRSIAEPLAAWHASTQAGRAQLVVCGHSLGAALATLHATDCRPDHLYTFGSPRVGDAAFVASLAGVQATRFVDCCDVVTEVPPPSAAFVHAGNLRYITHDGRVVDEPGADVVEADRAIGRRDYLVEHAFVHGASLSRELQDHAPINYVRAFFPDAAAGVAREPPHD